MEVENKRNNWLCDYRSNVTSQSGEDGVIEKIFELIGTDSKWCVEFGAGSGKKGNNTWSLIMKEGWSGVLIEAERALFDDLQKRYQDNGGVECINAIVEPSGKNSLDNLLGKTKIPKSFDFLSIDIDGFDYQVWQSLKNYQPRVVMIEVNPNIPIDVDFVQPEDIGAHGGSSLSTTTKLAKEKGYELVYAHRTNAVYVRKEFFEKFDIQNNSPAEIVCDKENYQFAGSFFQMYDGSIVLSGVDRRKLLAFRKKIKDSAVWVLEGDKVYPVKFNKDNKILRMVKDFVKKTPVYSAAYSLVKEFYGRKDAKVKKEIES